MRQFRIDDSEKDRILNQLQSEYFTSEKELSQARVRDLSS